MSEEADAFLAHYGIMGMKWGKHKTKDEVLVSRQAKRETRALRFDKKAEILQTRIDDLKAKGKYRNIGSLQKERQVALSDAEAKRNGKLSAKQKKVVIGASIVGGLTAAYLLQNNIQSGEFTRLASKGRELFGDDSGFKKNSKLADPNLNSDQVLNLVVKHVNPDFGAIGTKSNCRRATFSYEMRRRGYDVQATKTTNGNGQNVMGLLNAISPGERIRSTGRLNIAYTAVKEVSKTSMNPDSKQPMMELHQTFASGGKKRIPKGDSVQNVFETLAKEPNGSRGELGVVWDIGGGHSMAYEIFHGKPVVFDTQSGKKFENPEQFLKTLGPISQSGYTRLDNIDLNQDYLKRWMKNAK